MPRPICDERVTLRLPSALLADCLDHAARMKHPSLTNFLLNCIENELARLGTYRVDYYNDLRPMFAGRQGDTGRLCQAKDANV